MFVRICLLFIGRSHVVGCIVALAREESDDGEDMGWSGFILSSGLLITLGISVGLPLRSCNWLR